MSLETLLSDTSVLEGEVLTEEQQQDPVEQVPEEAPITPEETEPVVADVTPAQEEVLPEEQSQEPATEETPQSEGPKKLKVDYLPFLQENQDKIQAYQREKEVDYNKLSPEEIVERSLKLKYPNFSEEDVKEELKTQYGIGEDTEDYDTEELVVYKAKQRKLKAEAQDAKKSLEEYRESLSLPDFEVELEAQPEVDPQEVLKQAQSAQAEADRKWREESWTPEITKSVDKLETVAYELDIEGVGKVPVEVPIEDTDKKAVVEYLSGWVYHPTDNKYVGEDGNVDLDGFVKDRSGIVLQEKILAQVGKAAVDAYKAKFIKEEVVNLTQNQAPTANIGQYESEEVFDLTDKLRAKR